MKPLCVDCDGTLIRTDLLYESVLVVARERPWMLLCLFAWCLRGRAFLKAKVAELGAPNTELLPLREEVLSLIRERRSQGGKILLVTAATTPLAEKLAQRCGCFDEVLASDHHKNLKGSMKMTLLVQRFGEGGFDYAGDSNSDLPVWERAHTAFVVGGTDGLIKKVSAVNSNIVHLAPSKEPHWSWLKLLRIYQWAKNLIVYVPIVTSHRLFELQLLLDATLAFFAFSFLASATYILNDLCDVENDRNHSRKRHRPLAAGAVSIPHSVTAMVGLLAVAISLGGILGVKFLAVMAIYCSVSLLYSFFIKRIAILDVVTLAGLYAWRLVAGGVATGITLSNWLLAFALFIFVSLATLKRFVELEEMQTTDSRNKKKAHGRGYVAGDIQLIFAMGVAAAMVSVLVVILYVASPEVAILYSYPEALLFLAPLMLIWVARVWLLALRHELHEDPVLFAVKDTFSYMIAGLMLGTVILGKLLIR